MNETAPHLPPPASPTPPSWKKPVLVTLGIVLACCVVTAAATGWWVKRNFYASPLKPVSLSAPEQLAFNQKLSELEYRSEPHATAAPDLTEQDRAKTLSLSAKEINAFLAQQGLGEQLQVDLGHNQVSASFLLPFDAGVWLVGGTTLRIRLSLGAHMDDTGKLVVQVDDVRVGGLSLPNAWLGDLKGVDLVASNLGHDPAVKRLVAGIKEFEIQNGSIQVRLND